MSPLRLGTRGSALALCQARLVAADLERRGRAVTLVPIRTTGDAVTGSLTNLGGKGLFVKEIEDALLAGVIDLAVHSLKDMPAVLPPGLVLAATPAREDARDVLVLATTDGPASHRPAGAEGQGGFAALARGARVATSSSRRRALLLASRPDVAIVELRGNVDTRLRKLAAGAAEALLLAAAGLNRLGVTPAGAVPLEPEDFLPAIGQGALALETRADDGAVRAVVTALDHPPTAAAVAAERAFLVAVGGDCQTPIAAHATVSGDRVRLRALVAEIDGSASISAGLEGEVERATEVGIRLAERLLARGAAEIIARARSGGHA